MEKTVNIGNVGYIKYDMGGLLRLQKALKETWCARVGILGDKSERFKLLKGKGKEASPITNATIGFIHEKGSKARNIPRRSWLMEPIEMKLGAKQEFLNKAYVSELNRVAHGDTENLQLFFKKLGIACEAIIQEAFATSGFGTWAPLKHRKGSPLIDTGQLRKSVSSEAVRL